jgi:hypothetical protein
MNAVAREGYLVKKGAKVKVCVSALAPLCPNPTPSYARSACMWLDGERGRGRGRGTTLLCVCVCLCAWWVGMCTHLGVLVRPVELEAALFSPAQWLPLILQGRAGPSVAASLHLSTHIHARARRHHDDLCEENQPITWAWAGRGGLTPLCACGRSWTASPWGSSIWRKCTASPHQKAGYGPDHHIATVLEWMRACACVRACVPACLRE